MANNTYGKWDHKLSYTSYAGTYLHDDTIGYYTHNSGEMYLSSLTLNMAVCGLGSGDSKKYYIYYGNYASSGKLDSLSGHLARDKDMYVFLRATKIDASTGAETDFYSCSLKKADGDSWIDVTDKKIFKRVQRKDEQENVYYTIDEWIEGTDSASIAHAAFAITERANITLGSKRIDVDGDGIGTLTAFFELNKNSKYTFGFEDLLVKKGDKVRIRFGLAYSGDYKQVSSGAELLTTRINKWQSNASGNQNPGAKLFETEHKTGKNLTDIVKVNKKVEALSESVQYRVSYNKNCNDDVDNIPNYDFVDSGKDYTVSTVKPKRENYTFAGWLRNPSDTVTVGSTIKDVASNIVLYAKWEEDNITVTFDALGGKFDDDKSERTKQYEKNSTYGTLPIARLNAIDSNGWEYRNGSLTQAITESSTVKSFNHTLYATYNLVKIQYDLNGGSEKQNGLFKYAYEAAVNDIHVVQSSDNIYNYFTLNIDKSSKGSISDGTHTISTIKINRDFNGWENNGIKYSANSRYTVTGDSNIVKFYATWKSPVKIGNALNNLKGVSANYVLLGLSMSQNSSKLIWVAGSKDDVDVSISSDTTLYPIWAPKITFNLNGGSWENGESANLELYTNSESKISTEDWPTEANRLGYTFVGWSTLNDNDESKCVSANTTFTVPIVLYAVWKKENIVVTFDANKGKFSDGEDCKQLSVSLGSSVTPPEIPTRHGFIFKGWLGNLENIMCSTTVYAIWENSPIWYRQNDLSGSYWEKLSYPDDVQV